MHRHSRPENSVSDSKVLLGVQNIRSKKIRLVNSKKKIKVQL